MSKLMDELRRRHVFKVAIAYLVAGWLVLQVTDVVAGVIGLPDWTLKLVGFLFALGLPVVLLFSWIFEITPEGLKREKDLAADDSARQHAGRRLNLAMALLAVIAVPLLTVQVISRGGIGAYILPDSAPEIQSRVDASGLALPDYDSVAVLPFVNMSSDPDNEYFSDGLSEELLNLLVEVRGLRVPSRTSSFAFKGQNVELGVIGKALGVNHVLEGSVRRSGDRIRVTAQLIDVKTDAHIWSETYDRQMADIFEIQDDIAARIVAALRVSLGGQGILPERQRPTENLQAYDLYLQGLELFGQRGDGVGAAVGLLEQAVALDPDFAAAWATLAGVRSVTWDYIRGTDMAEELEASRVAAERALQLDPESSLAIAVLAGLDVLQAPMHWNRGLERFKQGIARHPRDASLRLWYGLSLMGAGYLEEAKMQLLAAYRQDPASGINNTALGKAYMLTGDLDKAVSHLNRGMALGHYEAPNVLRTLYFQMGLDDRVLEPFREGPGSLSREWWVALVDARQDPAKASKLLEITEDQVGSLGSSASVTIHSCLAELGLLDSYPDAVRASYASTPDEFQGMWYPWNTSLRQSPEFQPLVEELGLLELWRERGFPDLCREEAGKLVCS
jgi:adenylate cyclase